MLVNFSCGVRLCVVNYSSACIYTISIHSRFHACAFLLYEIWKEKKSFSFTWLRTWLTLFIRKREKKKNKKTITKKKIVQFSRASLFSLFHCRYTRIWIMNHPSTWCTDRDFSQNSVTRLGFAFITRVEWKEKKEEKKYSHERAKKMFTLLLILLDKFFFFFERESKAARSWEQHFLAYGVYSVPRYSMCKAFHIFSLWIHFGVSRSGIAFQDNWREKKIIYINFFYRSYSISLSFATHLQQKKKFN